MLKRSKSAAKVSRADNSRTSGVARKEKLSGLLDILKNGGHHC